MAVMQELEASWKERRNHNWLKKFIKRRVPISSWLPNYSSDKFFSDAIAGITVGLTVMPQGLAYATLAGLEPQVTTFIRDIIIFFTCSL